MEKITDNNYKEKLAEGKSLVKFFAPWCGPCKMMNPVVKDCEKGLEGEVNFFECDIDSDILLSQELKISKIPAFALFENGLLIRKHIGQLQKSKLDMFIDDSSTP